MTEQTVSFCQVVMHDDLVEKAWDDPRCQKRWEDFPEDPLRIPPTDPDPQVR